MVDHYLYIASVECDMLNNVTIYVYVLIRCRFNYDVAFILRCYELCDDDLIYNFKKKKKNLFYTLFIVIMEGSLHMVAEQVQPHNLGSLHLPMY
jgi:hypothetical protein